MSENQKKLAKRVLEKEWKFKYSTESPFVKEIKTINSESIRFRFNLEKKELEIRFKKKLIKEKGTIEYDIDSDHKYRVVGTPEVVEKKIMPAIATASFEITFVDDLSFRLETGSTKISLMMGAELQDVHNSLCGKWEFECNVTDVDFTGYPQKYEFKVTNGRSWAHDQVLKEKKRK